MMFVRKEAFRIEVSRAGRKMHGQMGTYRKYEEKGYTVTRPTDIDAWKEKVAPVYDKMYAAHPTWEGLVEMVRAAK